MNKIITYLIGVIVAILLIYIIYYLINLFMFGSTTGNYLTDSHLDATVEKVIPADDIHSNNNAKS